MKTSFTTMATPELPVEMLNDTAAKYAFDAVDIRIKRCGLGEIPEDADEKTLRHIRESVHSVSSILCYNDPIRSGIDQMSASIAKALALAESLAVPMIRIFTGVPDSGDLIGICKAIDKALSVSSSRARIVIQNHRTSSASINQAVEICEALNTDRVGIVLSPDHAVRTGETYDLARTLKYVRQLYISGDEENNIGIPSETVRPVYDVILKELESRQFQGYYTFKWERCWRKELAAYSAVFPQFCEWIHTYEK